MFVIREKVSEPQWNDQSDPIIEPPIDNWYDFLLCVPENNSTGLYEKNKSGLHKDLGVAARKKMNVISLGLFSISIILARYLLFPFAHSTISYVVTDASQFFKNITLVRVLDKEWLYTSKK